MATSGRRNLFYDVTGRLGPFITAAVLVALTGCRPATMSERSIDRVIGERGLMPGQFVKPRAIAIDPSGRLAVVDFQAMIQWLSPDGAPIAHWQTPTHQFGRPSGLGLDREGNLLVADSHYHRVLVYDDSGQIIRTYGGDDGNAPLVGRFGYIGDVETDSEGNIYIAESQRTERITKINPKGEILAEWGGLGSAQGQFQRVRAMAFDPQDRLYVADACNHRIQVFNTDGQWLFQFGTEGEAVGELMYPYDVALGPNGDVFVCEYGNSRVQRFSAEGEPLGIWGRPGRGAGELWNPWALGIDPAGRVYVVDSNNHRIQRVVFPN